MTNLLLVGGAGFIGANLVQELQARGHRTLTILDNLTMGNVLNQISHDFAPNLIVGDADSISTIREAIRATEPKLIFHLAANSDISKSAQDSEIDLRDTFATTAALATAIAQNPLPDATLVFSSTSAVFGSQVAQIGRETKKNPASSYGWMKLASERLLKVLAESGAVGKVIVVRFPNVTGRGQTHGVVKDLVAKYFGDNTWRILGDGSQDKPYIHVADLVKVLAEVDQIFGNLGFHEVNIAPDTSTKVSEIVEMIEDAGGLGRQPHFGSTPHGWPGDVSKYSYDTSELKKLGISLPTSNEAILRSIQEELQKHGR